MKFNEILPFQDLSFREKVLFILVLVFSWGGIGFALLLNNYGILENPGSFVWGCLLGSITLSLLALFFEKKDIVSILTPVYAVIIFFSMDLPLNLILLVLYSGTLTILLWRLVKQFGPSASIPYA